MHVDARSLLPTSLIAGAVVPLQSDLRNNVTAEESMVEGDLHFALTQIFLGEQVEEDALESALKSSRLRYSRELLVLILQQPYNMRKGKLRPESFEALVKMCRGVLDACVIHDDFTSGANLFLFYFIISYD